MHSELELVSESRFSIEYDSLTRYKSELSLCAKREEALRAEQEQELTLARERVERAESRAYGTQEELVRDLTASRDQV